MTETIDHDIQVELLLQGGHVIYLLNGIDGVADVAVGGGRIIAVGADLATDGVDRVIDVGGRYVTPGIIDMHAHVFHTHTRSGLSLHPLVNSFSSGVTTVVDAGTAGWRDFADFKTEVIDQSKVRLFGYVNIVGRGMGGDWEHDIKEMQPGMAAAVAEAFPEVVVGIKTAHYWAKQPPDDDHPLWAAVDGAVAAGEQYGLPVMVDFYPWIPGRSYQELILERMRPGDIHTHVFAQQFPIIDEQGKVEEHLWQARERGIIFDLGHGAGSFWFRNAVPAIQQGFVPDSISTDLHTGNVNGVVIDMLTTMNKILAAGVPLADVIAKSTVAPAREIGHPELGTLSPGSDADVAVLTLDEGDFAFVDCGRTTLHGTQRLRCQLTLRAGETVWNPDGLGLPGWEPMTR